MLQAESPTKLLCQFLALIITLIDLDSIASHLIIVSLETFLLDVVVVVMTALIVHPGSPNRSGSAFACLPLLASIIAGTYALGSIAHQQRRHANFPNMYVVEIRGTIVCRSVCQVTNSIMTFSSIARPSCVSFLSPVSCHQTITTSGMCSSGRSSSTTC
jgi:hypothetical protein